MRCTALLAATALLLSRPALAQTANYDYDRGTDFTMVTSYAWAQGIGRADQATHRRIVAAVDAELARKRFLLAKLFEHYPPVN